MGLMKMIFGDYSKKQIKLIEPVVNKIESLADSFRALSDAEMRDYTLRLKDELAAGKKLDDILPEAFALVREADERVLGKRPFRVQLIGGILLHQGRIAEMKTGEGKTLVATMPAYLNALTGKGVHIVTVNDYLAKRDSDEMGRVYAFLGLTTGLVVHGQTREEKQKAYAADITYGTNNEFGFDYLRDNMVVYKEQMTQRGHNFAIIDEVDSILIDEARTPLIISGASAKSTDLYDMADKLARTFKKRVIKELDDKQLNDEFTEDYIVNEKERTATLTQYGIEKAEKYFNIENLSDPANANIYHHINLAIRAWGVMKRDDDYIVKDDNVIIVDSFTGRLMPGRRYNEGLHQAIEAKEHVKIQRESKTLATITFQNYFRMYGKLSGMTGTALTEEEEFREIYKLDVVEVPTNRPMIRADHNDLIFRTAEGKERAIIKKIKECHEKGQPVLVGTISIEKSERLSAILKRNGIKHEVLNAKHHEREAEIVAQAGTYGAVTISTNMAGRGTDIMLGGNPEFMAKKDMKKRGFEGAVIAQATGTADTQDEEVISARKLYRELYEKYKEEIIPQAEAVRNAGGLFILGTERHESRRIDNQLRGRSGRQGDPGESQFFLSLQDDLFRIFGSSDRLLAITGKLGMKEDEPINAKLVSKSIESAQRKVEGLNFARRKNVITYDDVMNVQRNVVYQQRQEVLDGNDIHATIENMIISSVEANFDHFFSADVRETWNFEGFKNHYAALIQDGRNFTYTDEERDAIDRNAYKQKLIDNALELYHSKDAIFAEHGIDMREVERVILLKTVDTKWMDHLENMEELKTYIGLNSYAQRNPVSEYRIQGADMFDQMIDDMKEDTVRRVLSVQPEAKSTEREQVAKPTSEGFEGGKSAARSPVRAEKKVGRNDPCPCGSGKKYKNCCGANASSINAQK